MSKTWIWASVWIPLKVKVTSIFYHVLQWVWGLNEFKLIYLIAIVTCHAAPLSQHLLMNAGPIMITICHLDWYRGAMGKSWVFQTRGPVFDSLQNMVVAGRASDLKCSCTTLICKTVHLYWYLKKNKKAVSYTVSQSIETINECEFYIYLVSHLST